MPRSIWSGSISFGMVNIPVKVLTAVRDHSIHLHMLSKDGSCRLRRKLYCPDTGEEYDFKDTARGYEVAPSQYVILKDEELDQLKPEGGRTIDISDFVNLETIDPIYFNRSYYLTPAEGGGKAYKLLVDAMSKAGSLAIAQMVMRQKQYLVAIQVADEALIMHTMHYADEVQGMDEIADDLPRDIKPTKKEVEAAQQLIDTMTGEFDPAQYQDDYQQQVRELIESKAEGEGVKEVAEDADEEIPPTFDLMEALKQSVKEKSGKKKTSKKPSKKSNKKSKKASTRSRKSA
ncbi:Ku protein [Phycisphaerales bacterium AB-hyl4]|uniref:Non-homologous end joining protein Ku n=1 Tax=Natronomicrosphaera hydrolytica TaxID=3242702 RepID=A0ABV4U2T6_9BACT